MNTKKAKKNFSLYAKGEAARMLVTERRRYAPRVIEDKRRKDPKYKTWRV